MGLRTYAIFFAKKKGNRPVLSILQEAPVVRTPHGLLDFKAVVGLLLEFAASKTIWHFEEFPASGKKILLLKSFMLFR